MNTQPFLVCCVFSQQDLFPLAGDLETALSEEERARCARLVREIDRTRRKLFRGALRVLLAHFMEIPPDRVRFRIAPGGKPELDPEQHPDPLLFNVSHCQDMCCVAVSNAAVGADLEWPHRPVDALAIARHFFHPNERERLSATDGAARRSLFFRWWTAKEALLKAWGLGLSGGLARIDLSPWAEGEAARARDDSGNAWLVRSYLFAQCALALAMPERVRTVMLCPLTPAAFQTLIGRRHGRR